jgi:chemotaxis protein methyltransferase CheR
VTLAGAEPAMTTEEFQGFQQLLRTHSGIALGPQKRYLMQARLGRRLRELGLPSFTAYLHHLTSRDPGGQELTRFVNAMTTNKTDFFREAHHFRYLAEVWAPAIRARAERTHDRKVRLWSAGCSTGEEPYTLGMTVRDALGSAGWDLRILASDVDTEVLARAEGGEYTAAQVDPVPVALRDRYFARLDEPGGGRCWQVRPELRSLITFRRINFNDEGWPIRAVFDVIFCRNALIYFDRPGQQRILGGLNGFLKAGGLLCLGHSENVLGLLAGVTHVGHTIYRKDPPGASAP